MDAIAKALSNSQRSYMAAKASVSKPSTSIMAGAPTGDGVQQQNMGNAKQQLDAFRSWVYAAIRPICNTIAAQEVIVSKPSRKASGTKDMGDGGYYPVGTPLSPRNPNAYLLSDGTGGLRQGFSPSWYTKGYEPIGNHPIGGLLADPSALMTGYSLMWATVASLCLTGRAFWWVPEGEEQCLQIPPSWVKGHTGTSSYESWKVQPPGHGEAFTIPADRMVYFSMPSPSDPWGSVSPLEACAAAVNSDHDIQQSQRSMFGRGIHPSHAIMVGKTPHPDVPGGVRPNLSASQQRQIITAIKRRYQGTVKHGEPMILDGLIEDVKQLSHTPSEMDWQASGEAIKDRILQTFGTSPYVIGATEPGSRAASAVAMKHFYQTTINPLIRLMSEAMTEWLAPIFADDSNKLRVDITPAVADDDEMVNKRAEILTAAGAIKTNELREMMGLPPDPIFEQVIAGTGSNPIERGIRSIAEDALGDMGADSILDRLSPHKNGNGKLTV